MNSVQEYRRRRELRLFNRGIRKDEWNENDHPRDENGRFTSGGSSGSGTFSPDAYSKERKENAKKYGFLDIDDEYEKTHFKDDFSKDEKWAIETYTSDEYRPINNALRQEVPMAKRHEEVIDDLTNAIDRHPTDEDMYLKRSLSGLLAFGMFNNNGAFKIKAMDRKLTKEDVDELSKKLVGNVYTDDGFMSCDSASELLSGNGASDMSVVMNIYTPKGTKAMYLAPLSELPGERETLLQRGTSIYVTGVRPNENKPNHDDPSKYGGIVVDVEVVAQHPKQGTGEKGHKIYNGKRK